VAEGAIYDGVEIEAVEQVRNDDVLLPWRNRGSSSAKDLKIGPSSAP
jgi:hypothetical protein